MEDPTLKEGRVTSDGVSLDGSVSSLVQMKRTISLISGVAINVGIMIGSGIFISPKGVLAGANSVGLTLIIWSVCGIFSLLGALSFAELGLTFPSSGAVYSYLKCIFGDFVAFLYLWVTVLVAVPAFFAIVALTFGDYCIQPFFPDPACQPPRIAVNLIGTICLLLLGLTNAIGTRLSTRIQKLFTLCKVAALAIIIITGMVQIGKGETQNFQNAFEGSTFSGLGIALYSGLFSYTGWESLNFVSEEVKNPTRNLPRAIAISVCSVTVLYILTNLAYFTAMTPQELMASNTVVVMFGNKLLGRFAVIMPVFVALSTFGSINGSIIVYSRVYYVGSREKQLPSLLSMIHVKHLTPLPSIALMVLLSVCFTYSQDINSLINYFSFAVWTPIGAAVAGMVWLRWRDPDRARPYKVHIIIPVIFVIAAIFLVVMATIDAPLDTAIGICITLTGVPVYFLFVHPKHLPRRLSRLEGTITRWFQKALLVIEEEKD
ncbi:Y+L amino acid transporter 2-like [Asterias rubens]|uniref:Y+L amino acid transporter 2-like n=1 Tax=Asterias rubens TaxID=7604 RepID=UPI001455BCD0|nr:Y+L amino acid transporter 2-like [Asterias rubens]